MVIKRQVFTICNRDRFKLKMVKDNFWATTIFAPSLSKLPMTESPSLSAEQARRSPTDAATEPVTDSESEA